MKYNYLGARKRRTTSPSASTGSNNERTIGRQGLPAVLSTLELRRLVAAMVD